MPVPPVEAAPRSLAQAIKCSYLICLIGDPGWIRTSDLQLRRLLLYPLSYGAATGGL
jgi:hypothetical protein